MKETVKNDEMRMMIDLNIIKPTFFWLELLLMSQFFNTTKKIESKTIK